MIYYLLLLLLTLSIKITIGYRINIHNQFNKINCSNRNINDIKDLCNSYISSNNKIQSLDYTSLSIIVKELYNIITPSKVENVIQDNEHSIYIGIRTNSNKNLWLQLCWDNSYSRICLSQPSGNIGGSGQQSYSFGTILRTLLRDLYITNIYIDQNFERIITITFADKISSNDSKKNYKLVLEVMSARSNVILVTSDEIIQACAYQVPLSKSIRPLQTSNTYIYPPNGGGIYNPSEHLQSSSHYSSQLESFILKLKNQNNSIEKSLVLTYKGVSPNLARKMIHHIATLTFDTNVNDVNNEQYSLLFKMFITWTLYITDSKCKYESDTDKIIIHPSIQKVNEQVEFNLIDFTLPSVQPSSFESSSPNHFINILYNKYQNQKEFKIIKARCERKLNSISKKYESLKVVYEKQLIEASGDKVEQLQLNGDLITAYLHTWKESDKQILCYDFDTGEDIIFQLSLGQTPVALAASFYKKSKKLRRSISVVSKIVDRVNFRLEHIKEIEVSLSLLEQYNSNNDFIALEDIEDDIDKVRQLVMDDDLTNINSVSLNDNIHDTKKSNKRKTVQSGKSTTVKKANTDIKTKKTKATQGLLVIKPIDLPQIIVGRSAKQNDRISFDIAKENHIWFHAQGVPGAHCLLYLESGEEVSTEALQYAADIASFYSKAKGSTNVPVTYCNPKYLKRIKGASPGQVMILQQLGVIYGSPDNGKKWTELEN